MINGFSGGTTLAQDPLKQVLGDKTASAMEGVALITSAGKALLAKTVLRSLNEGGQVAAGQYIDYLAHQAAANASGTSTGCGNYCAGPDGGYTGGGTAQLGIVEVTATRINTDTPTDSGAAPISTTTGSIPAPDTTTVASPGAPVSPPATGPNPNTLTPGTWTTIPGGNGLGNVEISLTNETTFTYTVNGVTYSQTIQPGFNIDGDDGVLAEMDSVNGAMDWDGVMFGTGGSPAELALLVSTRRLILQRQQMANFAYLNPNYAIDSQK